MTLSNKINPETETRRADLDKGDRYPWGRIVAVCLWLGLLDSIIAFLWSHVHPTSSEIWRGDFAMSLPLGALIGTALAALVAIVLYVLTRLLSRVIALRGQEAALVIKRRLSSPAALLLSFLLLEVVVSPVSTLLRVWTGVVVLLVLSAAVVFIKLPPWLTRQARYAPLLLALLASLVVWYAQGAILKGRFGFESAGLVLLTAAVPLAFLALIWSVRRYGKWIQTGAFACLFVASYFWCVALAPLHSRRAPTNEQPSILFLVVDTLRADRVIGDQESMPSLKALAQSGIYYSKAYTPFPKTQPSMAAMNSGLFPWNNGVENMHTVLSPSIDTLAERLQQQGYRTAAFVHNPWIDYGMGHEQGFNEYFDYNRVESYLPSLHRTLPIQLVDKFFGRKRNAVRFQMDGRVLTDRVVSWLSDVEDGPVFLWVHLFDPHWPYLPPAEHMGIPAELFERADPVNHTARHDIKRKKMIFKIEKTGITKDQIAAAIELYNLEASYTDQHIARILKEFRQATKQGPEPLVIATSDHGESLGEHNYHFHHGDYTYDPCLKVPLIMSRPGHVPSSTVVDTKVMTVDILPTIASAIGIDVTGVDGEILPQTVSTSNTNPQRAIPFEADKLPMKRMRRFIFKGPAGAKRWQGIIIDDTKVIARPGRRGLVFEKYQLNVDPAETNNLFDGNSDSIRPYLDAMKSLGLSPSERKRSGKERDLSRGLSEAEQQRLEALGYIQ